MSCSKCYHELRQETNLYIECSGCGDRFHHACLNAEDLGSYFKAMREQVIWYCRDCAYDSDSTREELKNLWSKLPTTNYLQPPKNPKMEEAAQALEVLDTLMKTVDERGGSLIDKSRMPKRTKLEADEEKNIVEELTEAVGGKNTEMEVAMVEGEQEVVKEHEPKTQSGAAADLKDMLDFF